MRRCLHAVLVGVLTLSLSMNAARACWFARHGCHAWHHVAVVYPSAVYAGDGGLAVESCGRWTEPGVDLHGGWQIVSDVAVGEGVDVGLSSCECGGTLVVAEPDTVVAEYDDVSSVVGPAVEHLAVNGHREVDASEAMETIASPQPTLAEPAAVVPVLKPTDEVRQAVALGADEKPEAEVVLPAEPSLEAEPTAVPDPVPPLEEDVAEVEPPHATPSVPAVPAETNIFEEVDQEAATDAIVPLPAGESGPAEEAPSDATPTEEPPADESSPAEEPAAPADPFEAADRGPQEPARRWIDQSGDYAVVGVLRAVRGDGTCVLDAAGRTIEVSLQTLSEFDRSYATEAAERLAAAPGPESSDTAGL